MANEVTYISVATGENMYFQVRAIPAWTRWNTSGTPALEAYATASWANYAITLTETPAGGYEYRGDWPAGLTTVGWYGLLFYRRDGATAAITDVIVEERIGYWNGTTFLRFAANVSEIVSSRTAATNLLAGYDGTGYAGGTIKQQIDVQTIKLRAVVDPGGTVTIGTNLAQTGADGDTLKTLSDQLDVIDDYIDTEVAAIKAKTDLINASNISTTAVPTGTLTIHRGDDYLGTVNVTTNSGTKHWVTAKGDRDRDTDNDALFQVVSGSGLVRLNATAGTAAGGTVTNVGGTAVTIQFTAATTAQFAPTEHFYFDIQSMNGGTITTVGEGTGQVNADVTRATS